jgi:S1-C subfamily serine protease
MKCGLPVAGDSEQASEFWVRLFIMSLSAVLCVGSMDSEPAATGGVETRLAAGRRSRRVLAAWVTVVAVLLAVIGVLAIRLAEAPGQPPAPSEAASPSPSVAPTLSVTGIYQRVRASVVVVQTGHVVGTGLIIADNGTILTANHIVAGASDITVTFADGTSSPATVAGADRKDDVASLVPASRPSVVVPAALGGGTQVGAPVVTLGNPLGLDYSVTAGVISGLNRATRTADGRFSGLIQFDAPVNPGSSGGPLLDDHGLVIGIVVSIADPGHDDAFAGIGFAVPIGQALSNGGGKGVLPGGGPQI